MRSEPERSDPEPSCTACGSVRLRYVHRLKATRVFRCLDCELFRCHPLSSLESPSAGKASVATDEAFTRALIEETSSRGQRYGELARARHREYVRRLAADHYSLLEIGCGTGGLARGFLECGVDYRGIDLDERAVAAAGLAEVSQSDVLDFPETRQFDVVCFSQVLEHITTPRVVLRKIHRLLRPGGWLHCDVPNHDSLAGLIHRFGPSRRRRYGGIEWPHHVFSYRRRALELLLGEGFDNVEVFTANPTDPTWGQAGEQSLATRSFFAVSDLLALRSLLVGLASAVK